MRDHGRPGPGRAEETRVFHVTCMAARCLCCAVMFAQISAAVWLPLRLAGVDSPEPLHCSPDFVCAYLDSISFSSGMISEK